MYTTSITVRHDQSYKSSLSPLKQKKSKVSHHAHGSLFKKKKEEDDKSKSIDDGQVSLFTHAHDQSILMALLLIDTLFELAK